MERHIRLLDVIALVTDVPQHGLVHGHVGTVVESLGADMYEVEFSDEEGRTYAQVPLPGSLLVVLRHKPVKAV